MAATYAEKLKTKSTEWLLQQRGACSLDDESNGLIASEMLSRGITVPPLPQSPVVLKINDFGVMQAKSNGKDNEGWRVLLLMLILTPAYIVGSFTKEYFKTHTPGGILLAVLIIATFGYYIYSRRHLPLIQRISPFSNANVVGATQLMKAASVGDCQRVIDLINYGAPVDAITTGGFTALMYAAANGQDQAYALLLERGADPNKKSAKGKTASEIATEKGFNKLDGN